jgi:hypothetical protein
MRAYNTRAATAAQIPGSPNKIYTQSASQQWRFQDDKADAQDGNWRGVCADACLYIKNNLGATKLFLGLLWKHFNSAKQSRNIHTKECTMALFDWQRRQFSPVAVHAMVLNSVPSGSGLRRIKLRCGRPPVFDVRGL